MARQPRFCRPISQITYLVLLTDFFLFMILLLVDALTHPSFAGIHDFSMEGSVMDLDLIGIVRPLFLLAMCLLAEVVGTRFKGGYTGNHVALNVGLKSLLMLIPLFSLGYAIFKVAVFRKSQSQGYDATAVTAVIVGIALPTIELGFMFFAYVRVKRRNKYLPQRMPSSNAPSEESPLLGVPPSGPRAKGRPTSTRRIFSGLMQESTLDDITNVKAREPLTATASATTTPRLKENVKRHRSKTGGGVAVTTAVSLDDLNLPPKPQLPASSENETQEQALFRKRSQIALEIVETEERYVEILRMLRDVFMVPLETAAYGNTADQDDSAAVADWTHGEFGINITKQQVRTIFLELTTILQINTVLLKTLRARFAKWSPKTKFSDAFLGILDYFKTYITFANNFNNAIQTVASLRQSSPSFARFLTACLEQPVCSRMWLDDHLITPIQRIPRYILLLQQLQKRTPQDHPDFNGLSEAIRRLEELAAKINESKRKAEKSLMMVTIQRMVKYCPSIVLPTRTFINDFPATRMMIATDQRRPSLLGLRRQSAAQVAKGADDKNATGSSPQRKVSPLAKRDHVESSASPPAQDRRQSTSSTGSASEHYMEIINLSAESVDSEYTEVDTEQSPSEEQRHEESVPEHAAESGADVVTSQPGVMTISSLDGDLGSPVSNAEPDAAVHQPAQPVEEDQLPPSGSSRASERSEAADTQVLPVPSQATQLEQGEDGQDRASTHTNALDSNVLETEADKNADTTASITKEHDIAAIADIEDDAPMTRFIPDENVVFYLFNDALLLASHEVVQGLVGWTSEAFRRLNRDQDYLRPVSIDREGNEIMHKYKFQRMVNIDDVELVKYVPIDESEPSLDNAIRVYFNRTEQAIYKSPSVDERNFLLRSFDEAKRRRMADVEEMPERVILARRQLQVDLASSGRLGGKDLQQDTTLDSSEL